VQCRTDRTGPAAARAASSAIVIRTVGSRQIGKRSELQVLCRKRDMRRRASGSSKRAPTPGIEEWRQPAAGHWYGAFIGDRLVADLGVFHDGQGLGRYQSVETHPDFRRQGIAATLVYEAGTRAIAEHGLHTLVIIAEDEGDPSRLYRSLGFEPTEKSMGLLWWEGKPTEARE